VGDVKTWSTVASENSGTAPDYAPEGHQRVLVNDIQREVMAATRRDAEDPAWFDRAKGPPGLGYVITRVGASEVRLVHETVSTDATAKWTVGARVRVGDGSTFVYGYIVSSVYSAGDNNVTLDLEGASVVQATPTSIESHVTNGTVGNAAFATTGNTLLQDPPQIPTIDDLGDHVTLDQGPGNGLNADTVDGLHAEDIIETASASQAGIGLINGNFAVGQRGHALNQTTAFPTDNAAYVADGWALLMGVGTTHPAPGSGVVNMSLINSDARFDLADPRAIRLTGNASVGVAPTEKIGLIQWLPSDATLHLRGSFVSMSVWGRSLPGSNFENLRISLVQWLGTADVITSVDPIDDWGAANVDPTLLTNYRADHSASITINGLDFVEGSLENVEILSTANNIGVMVWADDTSWTVGDTLDITGVSLITGATARSYQHEDYATNLQRCQRFFNSTFDEGDLVREKGGDEVTALRAQSIGVPATVVAVEFLEMPWEFGTSMFKAPTIATYNPAVAGTTGDQAWNETNSNDAVLLPGFVFDGGKRRVLFVIYDITAASGFYTYVLHATADASL